MFRSLGIFRICHQRVQSWTQVVRAEQKRTLRKDEIEPAMYEEHLTEEIKWS